MPLASRLLLIVEAEIVNGLTENYLSEWTGFRRACAYAGRSVLLLRPRNELLALSHYSTSRERDTSLFFFALMSIGSLSSHYEDPACTFPHAREVPFLLSPHATSLSVLSTSLVIIALPPWGAPPSPDHMYMLMFCHTLTNIHPYIGMPGMKARCL